MSVRPTHGDDLVRVGTAKALREAGLAWQPTAGDRFVLADRDMDEDVFVVSDMVADVHEFPSGRVIGFNGTVEWALDSVGTEQALWLPSEGQLRRLLGGTFRRLEREAADGLRWCVTVRLPGAVDDEEHRADVPGEAYAQALLALLAVALD